MRRHLVLLLAALFCAFGATAQVNAEQVTEIGRNVMSMEDYMLAIRYFNLAIEAKPYVADPYFYRGLAKLELEDYKGAEEDCTKALELNKFKTEAYKLRGFVRQSMGKDSLAIADYDEGLRYNPHDKHFLFYKAVAQSDREDFVGADSTFATLMRLYPGFEEGFSARGRMELQRGDTVATLADVHKSLELNPSLLNSWLIIADVAQSQSNWEEARNAMDEAIKLRPKEEGLYVNRAYLRYNLDDYYGAMADYNYAISLNPLYTPAIFNRGLLRYEVRDLDRAAEDFTRVLEIDPTNFHALYNRGLIYLTLERNDKALEDFRAIEKRYPKFYPVYYAKAQALQQAGRIREAIRNADIADRMVAAYVKNPTRNPLDRPAIDSGRSNSRGTQQEDDETDEDVMNRFNQLMTISDTSEGAVQYTGEFAGRAKGKVQDRNLRPQQLSPATITLDFKLAEALAEAGIGGFRELDEFNRNHWLDQQLVIAPADAIKAPPSVVFNSLLDSYTAAIASPLCRPADYLGRGLLYSACGLEGSATADFDKAIELNPEFAIAYIARAASEYKSSTTGENRGLLSKALDDFSAAVDLNPSLALASYGRGCIYQTIGDLTSAIQAYTDAIDADATAGAAYYNRALAHLQNGNKTAAFADLSKAGELGIIPAYSLLKRLR